MPHLKVNSKLSKFLTTHKPLKVAYGGRNSGKSLGFGDMLAFEMATKGHDVLCLREYQDSIADSVHKVFKGSINERMGLTESEKAQWKILETEVVSPLGAKTRYMGASRNPDSIQSAENFKRSWFEEAHRAKQVSLDKLIPTVIRRAGAECWFSANPQSSADPFSQRFIVPFQAALDRDGYYEDDLHLIIKINWRDNPWYDPAAEKIRLWDLENLPRAKYNWIWEGAFNDYVEGGIIQQEWFEACIDAHIKLGFTPSGAEVVAHDPSDIGLDAKTVVYRHGSVILDAKEMLTGDAHEGMEWALDYAESKRADLFVWDEDGMGALLRKAVAARLTQKKIDFMGYSGGASVEDPDKPFEPLKEKAPGDKPKANRDVFYNRRIQQYYRLATRIYRTYEAVVKRKYHNPDDLISFSSNIECLQKLQSELCRLPLKDNKAGKIQLMTKEEMRKEGIPSPNIADACKMSLINPSTKRAFVRPSYAKW